MWGTVSLVALGPQVSSLPDEELDWSAVQAFTFHFLVTLPGLLLNRGGVAFWYFSIASAVGMISDDALDLDLKRSSRQNLNGLVLSSGVGGFLVAACERNG